MRASTGVGPAWLALADAAERELRSLGVPVEVVATISADGGLALAAEPRSRAANPTLQRYVAQAYSTCERCGDPGRARAGAIVVILCTSCSPPT